MKKLAILTLILSAFTSSCKKYEEDEGIRLRTVKQRLTRTNWILNKYIQDDIVLCEGEDCYLAYIYVIYNFEKNSQGKRVLSPSYSTNFEWEFIEKKSTIRLKFEDFFGSIEEYEILKLTNNELVLIFKYSNINNNRPHARFEFKKL